MNLQKRITFRHLIIALFLVLHVFLLNINVAEWGDSYRILRASEFIREGSYPPDEKRPPLYSLILSARPQNVDQVLFGRIVMLVISIASLYVFIKIINKLELTEAEQDIALLAFTLNPVYLYWSIRLMADVPFTLLVLSAFYFLLGAKGLFKSSTLLILGLVCGLAVLTRFEGYILTAAVAFGIILAKEYKNLILFSLSFLATLVPYLIYRNPFTSSYFEEPSGRSYDLKMLAIYLVSVVFVFGFANAFVFIYKSKKKIIDLAIKYPYISAFVIVELALALLWPAAIPRLLTPVIPFFAIILGISINDYILDKSQKDSKIVTFVSIVALLIFIIAQYFLKLQFLVSQKELFLFVVLLQIPIIALIFTKKTKYLLMFISISMFVWSIFVIRTHKDIFISVKNAGDYAQKNLQGLIIYNDISSVSDWYINQKVKDDNVWGYYYNTESKKTMTFEALQEINPDYLIITNEHNTTMELDIEKRPYLSEIKEFRYNVNGKEFFAKVVKFNKEFDK